MSRSRENRTIERARDYPRPPVVEETDRTIRVEFAGEVVAETTRALRVLERNHAPSYFIPFQDVRMDLLVASPTRNWCEWKGQAWFYSIVTEDDEVVDAAYHVRRPLPGYRELAGHVAFFPDRADLCTLDGERAHSQPGGYYSGWVTDDVEGPFRGLTRFRW